MVKIQLLMDLYLKLFFDTIIEERLLQPEVFASLFQSDIYILNGRKAVTWILQKTEKMGKFNVFNFY